MPQAGLRPFAHRPHVHVVHVQYYFRLLLSLVTFALVL